MTISLIGIPNVGKSTLVNTYMGMDLSIVTHRPQTTRNNVKYVALIDRTELIFIDTPGIHQVNQELNIRMNGQARESLQGVDVNLIILDLSENLAQQCQTITNFFPLPWPKTWVVFNKIDLAQNLELSKNILASYQQLCQWSPAVEKYFIISAEEEENIHKLTGALLDQAPNRLHQFSEGEMSNKNERFFAAEYIRQAAFEFLRAEVPYELAVEIIEYKNICLGEKESICHISAILMVNRPSQRAIVIGPQGANVKRIGTKARQKIEQMTGGRVFLNLHVKVVGKWFKNHKILASLGLPRVAESKRVWRQR